MINRLTFDLFAQHLLSHAPSLTVRTIFSTLCIALLSFHAQAQKTDTFSINNGEHTLQYTLFNSTFIPAEVAKQYGLKRSKYEWLMNVLISKTDTYGGVKTLLTGTEKNLLGQVKPLKFITIDEKDTVYYLVPIRVNGEDILHFTITATPEGGEASTVKFTDKVISD